MKKIYLILALALTISTNAFATQVGTRFIQDSAITNGKIGANAVDDTKIKLNNAGALKSENAASTGTVNMISVDGSDVVQVGNGTDLPSSGSGLVPTAADQLTNKSYVDAQVAGVASKTWDHELIVLSSTDITNQFATAAQNCIVASVSAAVQGIQGTLTADYTLSSVSSHLQISFVASTGWGTGSEQALIAGDTIDLHCQY